MPLTLTTFFIGTLLAGLLCGLILAIAMLVSVIIGSYTVYMVAGVMFVSALFTFGAIGLGFLCVSKQRRSFFTHFIHFISISISFTFGFAIFVYHKLDSEDDTDVLKGHFQGYYNSTASREIGDDFQRRHKCCGYEQDLYSSAHEFLMSCYNMLHLTNASLVEDCSGVDVIGQTFKIVAVFLAVQIMIFSIWVMLLVLACFLRLRVQPTEDEDY